VKTILDRVMLATHDQVVEVLLAVLKSKDLSWLHEVLQKAANLLLQRANADRVARSRLIEALEDEDPAVRRWVVAIMVSMNDQEVLGPIRKAIADRDATVRRSAVHALGAASNKETAVPIIIEAVGDSDSAVRTAAVEALQRAGTTAAIETLIGLITDTRPGLAAAALSALGKLRGGSFFFGNANPDKWRAWLRQRHRS